MNQDTFTLTNGQVLLQWPTGKLSREEYEDLALWLDLVKRRWSRAVRESPPPPPPAPPNEDLPKWIP